MNNYPITLTVESSDGVQFTVETMTMNVVGEAAFARTKTAEQLAAHGDFNRVVDTFAEGIARAIRSACTEGYAFFYWHRYKWPYMVGEDLACQSSGDPRSTCRKEWAYKWEPL